MELMPWQSEAVDKLANGRILYGGVGAGKSIAALAYYLKAESPREIVVITTARKRDSGDWQGEALKMCIPEITVDSWNNVGSYVDREGCFFIFDEQRVVGRGAWVKAFIKIARKNRWILLSATPGDTWMDYAPVFVANDFYANLSEFKRKHVKYKPFVRYPVIEAYLNEPKLEMMRNELLVEMPFIRHTNRVRNWMDVSYDRSLYETIYKRRWNPFEDQPVVDVSEMFRLLRRVVNTDPSRLELLRKLMVTHDRLIVFYTFNYELEILRGLRDEVNVYEYNGHRKDHIENFEDEKEWVYLVQYTSGAEAWNCTSTNAMVLWSLTHSYKNHEQCQGRIDRINTKYTDLFYYMFVSDSSVDRGIRRALDRKENFNERKFARTLADPDSFIVEGWGDLG